MTFKHYLQQAGYSPKTVNKQHQTVLNYISWLDGQGLEVEHVRHADLLAYIQHLKQRSVKSVTIQTYVRAIKQFYRYQISIQQTTINPAVGIHIQGIARGNLPYIFTPEQLHQLYHAYNPENIPKPKGRTQEEHQLIEQRNRVMLGLCVYQGIQSSELYLLETGHINIRAGAMNGN